MASTEKRGKKTREAVLAYCTSWTQGLYLCCWPTKGAGDATMEVMEDASLAVSNEMMAMLRHEIPEQDDTASASEPMRGDSESDLKSAAWQGFDPKFPDAARFDEPAPVPLWIEGKPDDGMPRREATQDELRHLRLYPERDELSGGGLKFKGLLFFNAAERLPADETKGPDKAQVQPQSLETENQRKGGRVSKYNRGVQEFVDRLSDKFAEDKLGLTLGQLDFWLTENAPRGDGYEPQPGIPDFDDVEYDEETLWWKDARGQMCSLKIRALEPYLARARSRDLNNRS